MTDHRGTDWVFSNLSKGEAEEYFRRYVDESEERVAAFIETVAARGGPALDFSEESMTRLGAWLMDELEEGPRESLPLWAQQPMGDGFPGRVSGDGLWLLDGAARYFAEALRRHHPHLRWMLNRNKVDTLFQHPMLVGFGASGMGRVAPILPILAVFTELSSDDPDEGWLGRIFSVWSQDAVEAEGSVSEEEPPMPIDEVEVTPVVGDPDWDAGIWVPEWAEAVLGERVFGELAGRLSGIEGVVDLAWEDRERFLVRTSSRRRRAIRGRRGLASGVDLKRLEADVAAVMRAAEADAGGEWASAATADRLSPEDAETRSRFDGAEINAGLFAEGLGWRFPDHRTFEIGDVLPSLHEAKNGLAENRGSVRRQADKDAALVARGVASDATWHFFASEESLTIGPDEELVDYLASKGIKVVIWTP